MNICFVTDDGYAMPTGITIFSIYKNRNPKIKYEIYVLCKNVSKENKQKLLELNQKNFNIEIIDCDNEDYSNLSIDGIPATPTSIYKFFIPNILSKEDKVLFLDGDIIVTSDLCELYNTPFENNYICGVRDSIGLFNKKYCDGNYTYINSGVMLMDLKKMRQDNIPNQLIEYRKTGYNKFMDQDAFNYVLKGKIKQISFKYNTQLNVLSTALMLNKGYNVKNFINYWQIKENPKTIDDIFNNANILHYTRAKPWKYYDGYGNDLWLYYYYNSQYANTKIIRDSYNIKKIVSTKTYKISYLLSLPKKIINGLFKNSDRRKQERFLEQFYNK